MQDKHPSEIYPLGSVKQGIWLFGVSFWVFGLTDRSIASLADGYLSAMDLAQLATASFFFVGWLFLKPKQPMIDENGTEL